MKNVVFVIRYALVWQNVMNKYGVGSLSVVQQFILLPGYDPSYCNHQTPQSILWTVYMVFHSQSNGWTMKNPEGKYIRICITISKQITIIFKGAMTLTLFQDHSGMASCLSTLVVPGFIYIQRKAVFIDRKLSLIAVVRPLTIVVRLNIGVLSFWCVQLLRDTGISVSDLLSTGT